jgi:dihydroorotate dehydrogenase
LSQKICGLTFLNPVGLSAGADKNCEAPELFAALGFGFLEGVSFTYQPQEGNPKPRIFRLPEDSALINRLGFPTLGAEVLAPRIRAAHDYCQQRGVVFGVNIAKSKSVDLDDAVEDYLKSFRLVKDHIDYLTVNVSSPNTPGLRELQGERYLFGILSALQKENTGHLPLFLKIAPDLNNDELTSISDTCLSAGIQGIVATNSTVTRPPLRSSHQTETGGLSGAPLHARALEIVRTLYNRVGDRLTIIGVGGICSTENAINMIHAGASLVEIYTGLVYGGPSLIGRINRGICAYLDQTGAQSVSEIRGHAR